MKRLIALLLALMMCLTLCACAPSKDKMLKEAITIKWNSVYDEYLDNAARANENYGEKIIKWTATVYDIGTGSVDMAESTYQGLPLNSIQVIFNEDEDGLVNINKGDIITIVGTLHFNPYEKIYGAYIVDD